MGKRNGLGRFFRSGGKEDDGGLARIRPGQAGENAAGKKPGGEKPDHVGIYVGDGQMIDAPHTGAFVERVSYYRPDLVPLGARP